MNRRPHRPAAEPRIPAPYELGGSGALIHIAHANGFPPASYAPLASALLEGTGQSHRIVALPSRPLWPGSRPQEVASWRPLAGDLAQGLQALGAGSFLGVGHSLGGVLTMWAAIDQPGLFRAVVLIDPVIVAPLRLWRLRLLRRLGLPHRQPLVQGALHRRRSWPDRPACFAQLRPKPLFARWPDASLWAYVEAATRDRPDGAVELVYPPEWEAHLFATIPLDVWQDVPRLKTPALVIRGERSQTFGAASQARMQRLLPRAHFAVIPQAGHLVPMERPAETAQAIQTFLQSVEGTAEEGGGRLCNPTIDQLRRALRGPLPGRAAQAAMAPRPRRFDAEAGSEPRQAGALLLLHPVQGRLHLVLTVRRSDLAHHPGQVSFPGGGREEGDASLEETALRETAEEIGIDPRKVEVLGPLTPLYVPPSHNLVHPFVAYTPEPPNFHPDVGEVDELVSVPLALLLDPRIRREEEWELGGRTLHVPCYAVGRHKIWGATAIMLAEFLALTSGLLP